MATPPVPSDSRLLIAGRDMSVRRVLERVDLELRAGELVTLVGPNGAGKSTLLKAAIGIRRLDGGERWQKPGLRVAYVPQHFAVDAHLPLTVRRFLRLHVRAVPGDLDAVAAETGIERLLERPMQALSGGEARRVLLARALMSEPELLALDEPAAGLDIPSQTEIYELIQRLRERRGMCVLIVSHDLHLVMAATDTVLCLSDGKIFCHGTPESVREHPEYRALFGHQLGPATGIYTHHHHGPECRH